MTMQKKWGLALSLITCAHTHPAYAAATQIEEFIVTASPHGKRQEQIAGAVGVLDEQQLQREVASTLGETLRNQPGINSGSFGPGVGVPIVRGLSGKRVEILSNGTGVADVSDTSPDHAIGSEPLLADRIEILRGPATLRYGPGAIGGVVNVIDNSIHSEQVDGIHGAAETRHSTNNDETVLVGRLDGGNGPFNVHLSGVLRDSNNVDIPGYASSDRDESTRGYIANTDAEADTWTFGASWVTDNLVAGASINRLNSNYGIPPGGHSHVDDHEDHAGEDHHEEDDHHDDAHEGELHDEEQILTRIDLEQTTYQGKVMLRDLEGFIERVQLDLNHTDYQHRELEIEEGVTATGTLFDLQSTEVRTEISHTPLAGWTGTVGIQHNLREFDAEGLEAFVPPSDTRSLGLYLIEDLAIGGGNLELGLRHDQQSIESTGIRDIDHNSVNASASLAYPLGDNQRLGLILSRTERAPVVEELLSNGEHVATRSYEIGNPDLDTESAWNIELSWAWESDALDAEVNIYHRQFADFIHAMDNGSRFSHDLADEGLPAAQACSSDLADFDNDQDEFEDSLSCLNYAQQDARFSGIEAEIAVPLSDTQSLRLWGDYVRARFDNGGDIPRIPPARLGISWGIATGPWSAQLSTTHALAQNDPGDNQDSTASYTRLDAYLRYGVGSWAVFVKGLNLSDEEIRNASSFLRDIAPEPGRSLVFGANYTF